MKSRPESLTQASEWEPSGPDGDALVESTAARVLRVAMVAFAREGYAGATTRQIASAAGVTLPVIAYHFGNKDGLHRACARDIVEQYRRRLLPLVVTARATADDGTLSVAEARLWLERILSALVLAITADADQRLSTDFVLREMSEQGPGYDLLFEQLWRPGLVLVADLVAIARGRKAAQEDDSLGATMLLASLTAFTRQEPVTRAYLGWDGLSHDRREQITGSILAMLDGLLART